MATLRESANVFEGKKTLNVAELTSVSTELDITERIVKEGESDEFRMNVITVDGKEYRVPDTVQEQLKAQLAEKPSAVSFKVSKTGEGLKTKYVVILLD